MGLFVIESVVVTVVQADDEDHAFQLAKEACKEAANDTGFKHTHVDREVKQISDLPAGWDGMCLPYAGDGNTRIAQILTDKSSAGMPA